MYPEKGALQRARVIQRRDAAVDHRISGRVCAARAARSRMRKSAVIARMRWSYAQMAEMAWGFARELEQRGIGKGEPRAAVGRELRGMGGGVLWLRVARGGRGAHRSRVAARICGADRARGGCAADGRFGRGARHRQEFAGQVVRMEEVAGIGSRTRYEGGGARAGRYRRDRVHVGNDVGAQGGGDLAPQYSREPGAAGIGDREVSQV